MARSSCRSLLAECDLRPRQSTSSSNTLFPNTTFIESEQAKIELSLWSLLLQRRLHMTNIMVDGVTLNLLRNKDGVSNWQLGQPSCNSSRKLNSQIRQQTATEPAATPEIPPGCDRRLDLGKLQLTHINVRYDNRQTDKIIDLKDLQIKTGRIQEKRQFPFETGFNLTLDENKPPSFVQATSQCKGMRPFFCRTPICSLKIYEWKGTSKGRLCPNGV